jgi:hypothetical protein
MFMLKMISNRYFLVVVSAAMAVVAGLYLRDQNIVVGTSLGVASIVGLFVAIWPGSHYGEPYDRSEQLAPEGASATFCPPAYSVQGEVLDNQGNLIRWTD